MVSVKQTPHRPLVLLHLPLLARPPLLVLVVGLVLPLLLLLGLEALERLLRRRPVVLEGALELLHPPHRHLEVLELLPRLRLLVPPRQRLVGFLDLTLHQHQVACLARHRLQDRVASEAPLRHLEAAVLEPLRQLLLLAGGPLLEPQLQHLQDYSGPAPRLHRVVLVDSAHRPPVLLEPRLPPHPVDSSAPLPKHRRRDSLVRHRRLPGQQAGVQKFNPTK